MPSEEDCQPFVANGCLVKRARLLVVMVLVALAACSTSKRHAVTSTTVTSLAASPSTSTTLTPVDQVPSVITVEYVQRVMDALDRVEGEATRMLYANKVPTPEWRARIMAIFDGKAFDTAEADYGRDAARGFDTYRSPPGDPTTRVNRIYDSAAGCIAFNAIRDYGSLLATRPQQAAPEALVFLRLKQADRDPNGVNPTTWVITADGAPNPAVNLEQTCH